jgi:hypothetical protein
MSLNVDALRRAKYWMLDAGSSKRALNDFVDFY